MCQRDNPDLQENILLATLNYECSVRTVLGKKTRNYRIVCRVGREVQLRESVLSEIKKCPFLGDTTAV